MSHHPAVAGVLRWFDHDHLPEHLQAVAAPFRDLAHHLADTLPADPELTTTLRDLLKAKDGAVRVAIIGHEQQAAELRALAAKADRTPTPDDTEEAGA